MTRRMLLTAGMIASLLVAVCLYLIVCCGGELQLLHHQVIGVVSSDFRLSALSAPSNACYHDNMLEKLGHYWHPGSGKLPFYITLPTAVHLSASVSSGCAAALQQLPVFVGSATAANAAVGSSCFRVSVTPEDKLAAYDQLEQLLANFTARQLEIFITDGSLIGSVRHFGIVPWDDDVDVMIRQDQKPQVRALLEALSAGDDSPFEFVDTEAVNQHWRLGIVCSRGKSKKGCRLAVDLFFGRTIGRWYVRPEWPGVYPLGDIYPLTWRPFGPRLLFPAPRRTLHYLHKEYSSSDLVNHCHYQSHAVGAAEACATPNLPCATVAMATGHAFVRSVRVATAAEPAVDLELLVSGETLIAAFLPGQAERRV